MHLYTVINFEDQYNIDRKIKEKNKCKHFFQEHSNFVYTDKSCDPLTPAQLPGERMQKVEW